MRWSVVGVAVATLLMAAACGKKTEEAPKPAAEVAAAETPPARAEEPPPIPESAKVPAAPTPRGSVATAAAEGKVRIKLPSNLRLTPGLRSPPGTAPTSRPRLPANLRLPGIRNPNALKGLGAVATAATGDDVVVREGATINSGAAPAVRARGGCKVTLNDCTLTSTTAAIMADGDAKVVVKGGKLTGGQAAIAARGRARVATIGTTVEGKTDQKDDAAIVTK